MLKGSKSLVVREFWNKNNKNHRVTVPKDVHFSERFKLNDLIQMPSGEKISYDNLHNLLSSVNNDAELNSTINKLKESYIQNEYNNNLNFYPNNTADFNEAVMQLHLYLHDDTN